MQEIRCEEILKATGGTLICGSKDTVFSNISTDSRKISPGDLFIPLMGLKFDGHQFIQGSLNLGAYGSLTQQDYSCSDGKVIIKVENTLKALGDIARYYRSKFHIPFVGITGSVGKTSTKDMVSSVLEQKYHVLKTEGNFNNEIGLPLTLLNLDSTHEAGVIEMGMSGFGEISRLTSIVHPDVAIITNIGMSHIEKLGSQENILKAKLEILEGLHKDGLIILNGDDLLLYGLKGNLRFRTVYYGMEKSLDYHAYDIKPLGEKGSSFRITIKQQEYSVHVPVPGVHNVYNALAAIAAGLELGIPMDKVLEGIALFSPGKMRQNIISVNGLKIIDDAYNASPQSMMAALTVLHDMGNGGRTIAVLGDMLEMGDWAPKAHYDVGVFAASKGIHTLVTVGPNGKKIAQGAAEAGIGPDKIFSFDTNEQAGSFLTGYIAEKDTILVKGSRGMKMEQIVCKLVQK